MGWFSFSVRRRYSACTVSFSSWRWVLAPRFPHGAAKAALAMAAGRAGGAVAMAVVMAAFSIAIVATAAASLPVTVAMGVAMVGSSIATVAMAAMVDMPATAVTQLAT